MSKQVVFQLGEKYFEFEMKDLQPTTWCLGSFVFFSSSKHNLMGNLK